MYTVYVHICPNRKAYVGITGLELHDRWKRQGIGYKGQTFYEAIKKFGWDNIEHRVLFENLTREEAEQKESEAIEAFDSMNPEHGYNRTVAGYTHMHTEETKRKMSQTRKGRHLSEQHKMALSRASKGRKLTEKQIENLVAVHRGKPLTQEHRDKISKGCRGKGKKKVIQYTLDGVRIRTFDSITEATESVNGKTVSAVSSCCRGRKPHAYGYVWKYA